MQILYDQLRERNRLRILVIKLRAVGDVLLSTIVLNNLREAFPGARIDFLTEPASCDMVTGHPAVDRVHVFRSGKDNFLRFLWMLNRRRYDLVFDLFCNPRSAQMTFATRAPYRVGYPFRGRAYAYNIKVEGRRDSIHNTQFNLDALRFIGIPVTDERISIHIDAETSAWADEYVATVRETDSPLIALNPSGTWSTKRWGLNHFAQLGDALVEKCNARILLLWGPGERPDAEAIASSMRRHATVIPPTSLKQLAALLARCDYLVSNDSGPMHIGAAMGLPVLGIFGPTNPHAQGPYNTSSSWVRKEDLDCLECNLTSCPIGNICMTDLPVDSVLRAFQELLEQNINSE